MSLRWLISEGLAYTAIAVIAICYILLYLTGAPAVNRPIFFKPASFFESCLQWALIHLWSSASAADNLLSGLAISFFIRSFASLDTISHSSPSNAYLPFYTKHRISWSSSPQKAG